MWLLIICFLNICFDLICTVLISFPSRKTAALTEISLVILYILQVIVPAIMLYHIMSQLVLKKNCLIVRNVMLFLPVIMAGFLLTNHWSGLFFSVNPDGIYERGPWYLFMYAFAGLYLITILIFARVHASCISGAKIRAVYELFLIVGVTVVLQAFYHDVLLTGFGITLGITILFFTLDNPFHHTDNLTGSFDIQYFRDRTQFRIDNHRNFHVLALKLNQLKRINLVMGADIGNQLLEITGNLLKTGSRKNLVFRVNGNQFIVLSSSTEEITSLSRQTMDFFANPVLVKGVLVNSPVSVCCIYDAAKLESSDNLISYIEYLLKLPLKSTESSMIQDNIDTLNGFQRHQLVEGFLDTALEDDLFQIAYQPIYSIREKRFVAVEALSRLYHPELGWISPDVFITMAEKNDQISEIGLLQLRKICTFIKENPKLLELLDNVKINLSPGELMKSEHVSMIIETIREFGLPSDFFQFEITETVATRYNEMLGQVVDHFAEAGIRLCMDDFGSGFSNLNTVMKFPFEVIKLDRSLLFGICQDQRISALYRSLITTFHNIGYSVVAEGVETEEEAKLVSQWGVDLIQGFYYAKPMPGYEVINFLNNKNKSVAK